MLAAVRASAERAGRDPMAITPCFIQVCLIGEDDDALAEILRAPLVKAFLLQVSAETLRGFGFEHPMGDGWRGFQDIDPAVLTRERISSSWTRCSPRCCWPWSRTAHRRRSRQIIKTFVDAGLRVPKILDYGAMAGLSYAASSAANVRCGRGRIAAAVRRSAVTHAWTPASCWPPHQAETGLTRLRRPDLAGALRGRRRASQRPRHGRRRHRREAAQVCRWLLTSRLEFIEDRNALPDRRRGHRRRRCSSPANRVRAQR